DSHYYRTVSSIVTLLILLLLMGGCGHRAVHGTSHAQKSKKMNINTADGIGQFSSLDELARGNTNGRIDHLNQRPNGLDRLSANDGLLSQEAFGDDDESIKDLSPADLAQQYWNQRQQAEYITNQSGLKDIFFELDSWELTKQAKQSLAINAEILRSDTGNAVTIEGHCDERGTRAYNYVLGEKRALRVRNYLSGLGVSPSQLTVMSYGKDNPVCRGDDQKCFRQNRRAHFLLGIKVADARLWDDESERVD
ncbi:MAG: OmpA family protein, partial [Nitrospirales bacterium]